MLQHYYLPFYSNRRVAFIVRAPTPPSRFHQFPSWPLVGILQRNQYRTAKEIYLRRRSMVPTMVALTRPLSHQLTRCCAHNPPKSLRHPWHLQNRPAKGPPNARNGATPARKQETKSVAHVRGAAPALAAEAVVFASKANVLAPTVILRTAGNAPTRMSHALGGLPQPSPTKRGS